MLEREVRIFRHICALEDRLVAIQNAVQLPLSGKIAVQIGDSMIQGTGDEGIGIPQAIASRTGLTVFNCGIGGTRMARHGPNWDAFSFYRLADAIATGDWLLQTRGAFALKEAAPPHAVDVTRIISRCSTIDWSNVDYLIVSFGTNDFTAGEDDLPVLPGASDSTDTTTISGAMNYGIARIMAARPKMRLFFTTPLWRTAPRSGQWLDTDKYPNKEGLFLIQYVDTILDRAAAFHVPAVDLYRHGAINAYNWKTYLIVGGTHQNDTGSRLIGDEIGGALVAAY